MPSEAEIPLISMSYAYLEEEISFTSKEEVVDVYERFSRRSKWGILATASFGGLLPLMVGWSFVPSIPQIAVELESTPSVISLGVSVSIFASALGSIAGATYSGFYGRRAVYLYTTPILFFGSMAVYLAQSVPQLMFWRFVQAMGSAPGISVGAGVIGDIYKLEERGRAMSVFFSACLLGPALSPLVGGITSHYFSWRIMQLILGLLGLILFVAVLVSFPETSHPGSRTIDKMGVEETKRMPKWRPVILNPLSPLALLRSPVLLLVAFAATCSLYIYQVLLLPLAYTLGVRFHITNEAVIGACFIAAGMGSIIGTPVVGYISDMTVIRWKKKRNGVWYPEDRLRPALLPLCFIIPVSSVCSGLLSAYGVGNLGLGLNLVCLFSNAFGLEMVWGPAAAYVVDAMNSKSAQSIAAIGALRSIIISLGITTILPMIDSFGVVKTNCFAAAISFIGFGILWCVIRYGEPLREVVDVGFTRIESESEDPLG